MRKKLKVICIIPARGGSKGIKFKNLKKICGKPLIYYPIKAALKSKVCHKILVSTDSKNYQNLAIKFGAEAPFLRPKKISRDNSHDKELVVHTLKYLLKKKYFPDLIIYLRPTTPNRNPNIIDNGIKYLTFWAPCAELGTPCSQRAQSPQIGTGCPEC